MAVDCCKPALGQHGHHEAILEPTYKLCAVLIKYLYRNQIQVSYEDLGLLKNGLLECLAEKKKNVAF
jgi:hypothetical protein